LAEKKEKWRKKRSILEAKRRRLGYFNDNDLDDEEKDGLPEVEKAESAESDSNAPPTATTRKPWLFIDGVLSVEEVTPKQYLNNYLLVISSLDVM